MSLDGTLTTLIAGKRLHRYQHSNPAAHTLERRLILFAKPVIPWLDLSPPASSAPKKPTPKMIAALRAKLDAILSERWIPVCEGRRSGVNPCDLKRLQTGLAHEAWSVRADPPDALRAFGFFVGHAQLLLTHADVHPAGDDEWDQQIRWIHLIRTKLGIPPTAVFKRASIHDYL
jgi:hypothetical protein